MHDVTAVAGEADAFETLKASLADTNSMVRTTVVENVKSEELQRTRGPAEAEKSETIGFVSEPDPETIILKARLTRPGFVVVADTFYPGWAAYVDGAPTPIHPANLLFRAVYVPEGEHSIVMKYSSSWLCIGAIATAVGLLLVAVLFVRQRRVCQRSHTPNTLTPHGG